MDAELTAAMNPEGGTASAPWERKLEIIRKWGEWARENYWLHMELREALGMTGYADSAELLERVRALVVVSDAARIAADAHREWRDCPHGNPDICDELEAAIDAHVDLETAIGMSAPEVS